MVAFFEIFVEWLRLVEVFAILCPYLVSVQMLVRIPRSSVKERRVLHEPRHSGKETIRSSHIWTSYLILVVLV